MTRGTPASDEGVATTAPSPSPTSPSVPNDSGARPGTTTTARQGGAPEAAPTGERHDDTGSTVLPDAAEWVDHQPRPLVPGTEWLVRGLGRPLTWMWNRGFRFLFILDAIGFVVIMTLTNLVRFGTPAWPDRSASFYVVGLAIAITIQLTINYFFGLYEREPRLGVRAWLPRALFATTIGVAVQGLATLALDRYLMPRGNLAVMLVVGSIVLSANRRMSRFLAVRREGPPRVVLVGPPEGIQLAEEHLSESDRDAVVVGHVEQMDDLTGVVESSGATDVLLLDVSAFGTVFPEPLNQLEDEGVGFLQRVSARETLLGLQSIRQVAGMPFVRLHSHTVATHKLRSKRLFDRVLVLATAPVWLVVIAVISLYVAIRAGRPIFYRQERVGLWGRRFQLVKFRTMVPNAEENGAQLSTGGDDPRIVKGLGWMRSMRADELPQLWNIIRGQMSLVGPRPERPELVDEISSRVPGYMLRHELPPGLTGLAQTHGRYTTDAEYKLGYDLQYMVNWSPVLDIQILARTIWVVLARRV